MPCIVLWQDFFSFTQYLFYLHERVSLLLDVVCNYPTLKICKSAAIRRKFIEGYLDMKEICFFP